MIDVRIMRASTTGRELIAALRALGVTVGSSAPNAVVCYGVACQTRLPALNMNAGRRNKLQELTCLRNAGVATVPFSADGASLQYPMLARALRHARGSDIRVVLGPTERGWLPADFYTQYVPLAQEFRVWVYRQRNIGTYEKVMRHPERYRKIGSHYGNGFTFEHINNRPELLTLAARAVDALNLDFGAVDILRSTVGVDYVLEVNTAPGTTQRVIERLAARIKRWQDLGFPNRRGAE